MVELGFNDCEESLIKLEEGLNLSFMLFVNFLQPLYFIHISLDNSPQLFVLSANVFLVSSLHEGEIETLLKFN